MIRPVETLTQETLIEEHVLVPNAAGSAFVLADGVWLRVGPGAAQDAARRVLGEAVGWHVDQSLQPHEWAPVWEGVS